MEQHPMIETFVAPRWRVLECPMCDGYAVRLWSGGRPRSEVVLDASSSEGVIHSWTP